MKAIDISEVNKDKKKKVTHGIIEEVKEDNSEKLVFYLLCSEFSF